MFARSIPSNTEMSRLLLAKRSYLLAGSHRTDRDDPASRIAAVVLFDFALEATMKLAVEALGNSRVAREFPSLLQQLDAGLATAGLPPLTSRSSILAVHDLRNASQHNARYPNDTELDECFIYSRDSLRQLVTTVWDADFDRLSLAQLVRDNYARRVLEEAELALQSSRWIEAVSKAAYSLSHSLEQVSSYLMGLLQFEMERLESSESDSRIVRAMSIMADLIENTLLASALGLDLNALRRIRSLTGYWVTTTGTNIRYHHINPHLTEADALFVIDAALAAVLKIEEQAGNLEQPFGFNLWIDDAINGVLTRHHIVLSEDRLPEIPQTPNLSFDKATVDKHQRLRLHRAVTALRNASRALQRDNPKHADLLQVIEQYIIYNDRFSSEFDDDNELAARRLLAAIRLVGTKKD